MLLSIIALAALLIATSTGCGSRVTTADGTVSFEGQPVEDGTISFESADGKGPSAGSSISGGKYHIARMSPGNKTVRITAQRKTGRKVPLSTIMPPEMVSPTATTDEIEKYIPVRYNEKSELTKDVVAGANTFDFDLKK